MLKSTLPRPIIRMPRNQEQSQRKAKLGTQMVGVPLCGQMNGSTSTQRSSGTKQDKH